MKKSAGHRVMLVSEEPATIAAVTAALQNNGRLVPENVCRDLPDLAGKVGGANPAAVLVDIDVNPIRTLAAMDPLVREHPDVKFVVLAGQMHSDLMLEAMQAGARHYLVKQTIPSNLHSTLYRLCGDGAGSRRVGQLVTVLSAGGGCGATTVAVNLACEMQRATSESTLLLDFDSHYGGASAALAVEAAYGVLELQDRPGVIDAELVATTAGSYSDGLKVLINAAADRTTSIGGHARLREIVEAAREAFSRVVVDAPRLPLDVTAELATASAACLLVLQLSVKQVRMARSILAGLAGQGVARESITVLVNRYRRRGELIELAEAQRALQVSSVECLPNDYAAACESINYGQPLEQAAPRSPLRKEISRLAEGIVAGVSARS